jgi:copper(I)-binding protein
MKTLFATLLFAACAAAQAAAPVKVEGAWARVAVKGQDSSGAYMTLTASEPLTLLGGESPAAGIVEMHEMKMQGDIMKMRAAESLPLAPGKPLKLAPGGYHFMLMDLKTPFNPGGHITMTLRFKDAKGKIETVPVTMPVSVMKPAM